MDSLLTFRYNFEHCSFECVVALLHISVMPGNEVMFSVFLFHLAVLDIRMIFTFDLQHLHTKILYGENVFNAFLICPFSLNYCTRISCLFFFFFDVLPKNESVRHFKYNKFNVHNEIRVFPFDFLAWKQIKWRILNVPLN